MDKHEKVDKKMTGKNKLVGKKIGRAVMMGFLCEGGGEKGSSEDRRSTGCQILIASENVEIIKID